MQTTDYARLEESLAQEELPNGLRVYILPKHRFRQTYACFTTHYGSLDQAFRDPERDEIVRVPDGIAHFLEHKMFEKEHGDVFRLFSEFGAQPNAYTSFDLTTYLFSCTSRVEDNLTTLLDFVQQPYFTDESVEKERGIIKQELLMYEDNANRQTMHGLLKALFGVSSLSTPVGGTVESIQGITKEDLHTCYRAFYHPGNMILFVVGPVDAADILRLIEANQAGKEYVRRAPTEHMLPAVPERPAWSLVEHRLAVAQPRVAFGFKQTRIPETARARQRYEEATGIWMDALLGRGSQLFHRLVDEGLCDMGFGADYELTSHYGYSMMGGNSKKPLELAERVRNALLELCDGGLSEEAFLRTKRKAIGRFFGLLDSPQAIASLYTSLCLRDVDLFQTLDALEELSVDDVREAMRSHVLEDQFAVSVVWPVTSAG